MKPCKTNIRVLEIIITGLGRSYLSVRFDAASSSHMTHVPRSSSRNAPAPCYTSLAMRRACHTMLPQRNDVFTAPEMRLHPSMKSRWLKSDWWMSIYARTTACVSKCLPGLVACTSTVPARGISRPSLVRSWKAEPHGAPVHAQEVSWQRSRCSLAWPPMTPPLRTQSHRR